MQSRDELLQAIRRLPDQTHPLRESQKEAWLGWLTEYDGPGFYGRKNSERSPRFIFNRLSSASMIIWLAEASGVEERLIKNAVKAANSTGSNRNQATAVRAIIPWGLVETNLQRVAAASKMLRHFVAYHNTDKRGPYRPNKKFGTFLTNKNFRAETLRDQHLWIFEGSGLPKVYRLASHGTINGISRNITDETTVRFKIEGPQSPIVVTGLPWFDELLVRQRSFANGFSSLNDVATIRMLEQIADQFPVERTTMAIGANLTTTEALIDARLGQGRFRAALEREWHGSCAVTGCGMQQMLRASHIKPWEASTDAERLDPHNGLLLSAHIDALFDGGLISFADDGKMLLSHQISTRDKMYFRLPKSLRVKPSNRQVKFLDYHRNYAFEA